jgi:hypothetical protein
VPEYTPPVRPGELSTAPIFIFGVPRSGTTLLRTMLDSHSRIACGPETPWLGGHQPRSVMEVWKLLREHPQGYCASYGMPRELATKATRDFVATLMEAYAAKRGKARWAEKTPDNALHIPFLLELFPEARVVWLVRDGLDVAISTSGVPADKRRMAPGGGAMLSLGPGVPQVANSAAAALLRWRHWNRLIGESLLHHPHTVLNYEDLVRGPEQALRGVMECVGETFEPRMIEYSKVEHDHPAWEWGAADVRARPNVTGDRIGRAGRELNPAELDVLATVQKGGRSFADLAADDPRVRTLAESFGGLGRLASAPSEWDVWDAAWMWLTGLGSAARDGARFTYESDDRCPLPWALAMAGAQVRVASPTGKDTVQLVRVRDAMRVPVRWDGPSEPADAAAMWRSARTPADDAPRLKSMVKPGGMVAASWSATEAAIAEATTLARELAGGRVVIGGTGTQRAVAVLGVRPG